LDEETVMKRTVLTMLFGVTLLGASSLGCGCSANVPNKEGGADRLNGGGSSFVAPMMKKWAGEYHKAHHVEIDYTSSGSGDGVSKMVEQKNDFGCTDAPMNDEQLKQAAAKGGDVMHIPLVMGGVVPIYNLPGVDKPLQFTGPLLAKIFLGKIKNWNDEEIAKLNKGVKLPDDLPITVAHRSDASGTSYIFTDYLSKVSPEWKEKVGPSTEPRWPVGAGAPKNPGVAGLVKDTKGAIGYVELLYALQEKDIRFGDVENKDGKFVRASPETVTAAATGLTNIPDNLVIDLNNAPGADTYPISGTVYMVFYVKQPKDKAKALKEFIHWITHEGQDMAKELHYARLPQALVERIDKKLEGIKGE
jgi:phosphate transport system substrate-binding protein